jgi:hypothetical protein
MCNIRKSHATPWAKLLGQATYSIRYWDARIIRHGIRNNDNTVLIYYILISNVNRERFHTTMTITCIHQLTNSRSQLKYVLKDANSNGSFYELEVATDRVERIVTHLTEYNPVYAIEREEQI